MSTTNWITKARKVSTKSDEVYKAPWAHTQLAYEATTIDRKTTTKSILHQGLKGINTKKLTPVTTTSSTDPYKTPNRIKHSWDTGGAQPSVDTRLTYLHTSKS